ncbi:MAG: NAD(P)/FAD-dependent oxidoreductase [Desulfobacterales bacterium]
MRIKKEYDAVVIGGGHNGLTLGAYLQRAGLKTAVFERRHEEGSAIFTSECTAPGFLHNLHAQYMEFLEWMPVWYDFDLPQFGARSVYPTAQAGLPFSDGRPPLIIYSVEKEENYEKTYQSVARYSKNDAETLLGLLRLAKEQKAFAGMGIYSPPPVPTPENPDPASFWQDMYSQLLQALGLPTHLTQMTNKEVIDYLYESDEMRTMFYRLAVEWGVGLDLKGTGGGTIFGLVIFFNWQLMVGGTHTLAHAIEMAGVKEGMEFFESCEVVNVLLDGKKAVGVRLKDGTEVKAKLVASNADIKSTMLDIVGEENLSSTWTKPLQQFKHGPSFVLGSTAMALHEAPDFKSARWNPDINMSFYTIVGFDSAEEMYRYCHDAHSGRIPETYGEGIWVNSLWDPTYAPPGKHSLTGWIFLPQASTQSREKWEEVRATWNDNFLNNFQRFAPNMTRDNVIDDYFYTPQDQEDEMRLMEGSFANASNIMDVMTSGLFPEARQYRTEIENLYLCGPYMHPGPGANAGPGYCCFKIIADDFGLDKFWERSERGY